VATYQRLITELPPLNRQLLLYILDLLAVFSSKSDLNRMTAANLAAIFQPGIISHPNHDMAPSEYRLSQDVLIYLIENQDNFLIGMTGTAVDEKTVKDVESGAPTLASPKTGVGRSASNASAGADSLRKYGVRRNVSVSSRGSNGISSPGTPTSGIPLAPGSVVGGIARSNTLPTKKSPALNSTRFQKPTDPSTPTSVMLGSPTTTAPRLGGDGLSSQVGTPSRSPIEPSPKTEANPVSNSADLANEATTLVERLAGGDATKNGVAAPATQQQPAKERKISQSAKNFFARSPTMGPVQSTDLSKEPRQPNRLKKKPKIPGSASESAQSSQNSLQAEPAAAFHTPLASPARLDPLAISNPILSNTAPTPVAESQPPIHHGMPGPANDAAPSQSALKPPQSREASVHSRSSFSDLDAIEDPALRAEKAQKRGHRWRLSSSTKRDAESPLAPPPPIGQNPSARLSTSSIGSSNKPRKSFTGDSQLTQQLGTDTTGTSYPPIVPFSSQDSSEILKDNPSEPEKKGIFGKWKAKISQSKEEKKEREMEKERAKSPPRSDAERAGSKNNLSAFAQEHLPRRGRSMDLQKEEALPKVPEAPSTQETTLHQPAPTSDPQENTGG
jgi:GTPase-activating protein SAC7